MDYQNKSDLPSNFLRVEFKTDTEGILSFLRRTQVKLFGQSNAANQLDEARICAKIIESWFKV